MVILGAHMSIAGGFDKAVERAAEEGCDCVQIFTKNNNQWRAKAISPANVSAFRSALQKHGVGFPIAHASYLINLASPDPQLWEKSVDGLAVELRRADQLGLPGLVVHPGSFTTSSETIGLGRVAAGLNECFQRTGKLSTRCLLENTAGQGTNLGWRFEHLAVILSAIHEPAQMGICIDTCHAFAAGYGLRTARQYEQTMGELAVTVGLKHVRAVHLNDSKRERGSRVDRHENIGRGKLGIAPFRQLLRDERFSKIPMYLETPKGIDESSGRSWDAVNLARLRRLVPRD